LLSGEAPPSDGRRSSVVGGGDGTVAWTPWWRRRAESAGRGFAVGIGRVLKSPNSDNRRDIRERRIYSIDVFASSKEAEPVCKITATNEHMGVRPLCADSSHERNVASKKTAAVSTFVFRIVPLLVFSGHDCRYLSPRLRARGGRRSQWGSQGAPIGFRITSSSVAVDSAAIRVPLCRERRAPRSLKRGTRCDAVVRRRRVYSRLHTEALMTDQSNARQRMTNGLRSLRVAVVQHVRR
jgi:hypothetical protein